VAVPYDEFETAGALMLADTLREKQNQQESADLSELPIAEITD
jgi:hypothetical protein